MTSNNMPLANGHQTSTSPSVLSRLLSNDQRHDTDSPPGGGDPRTRPLRDPEIAAVVAVGVATLVLGVIGLVNSFHAVAQAARPSFGAAAWTVPVAVDIGILVFSALDLVLARLDMRLVWLRLVPWSLVAVTIYLNIANQHTLFGIVAHAALPAMWVIAVEVATHAVRVRAGLTSEKRMDRIRFSRWLLAPFSTAGLWRRQVLWEIRSYLEALAREKTRLLALTGLQDRYGRWAWRWRAPRRERALYKLGELAPDDTLPTLARDTDATGEPTSGVTGEATGVATGQASSGVSWPRRNRRDVATRITRLRRAHPGMSVADIAKRTGVSTRTVQRHLSPIDKGHSEQAKHEQKG